MRFCFVILHYLAEDVTADCVNRLRQNFGDSEVGIVVVDNGSPDGSGKRLENRFRDKGQVNFVFLRDNLGFAAGNNAGYRYARDKFNPGFIVVMNNDVMVEDAGFLTKIQAEYDREPFAVLGPDIYSPAAGVHQNPARLQSASLQEAKELRNRLTAKEKAFCFKYLKWKLKLRLGLAREIKTQEHSPEIPHRDCVLHGACYIFSKDFISRREDAFNDRTFLYMEEDILAYECGRDGLKMRYSPDLKVQHLEDVSTKAAFRSEIRRAKVRNRRMSESLDVLISIMEK